MPADLSTVQDIVRAAYQPYVARIGREPGPMADDYTALIACGAVHVVEQDGDVLGLIVLKPEADALLIENVAVAPAAQGGGLGRLLLHFAEEAAAAAGFTAVTLYTNEAMTENLAIYARYGYRETDRREEKGFRRVYMRKVLR